MMKLNLLFLGFFFAILGPLTMGARVLFLAVDPLGSPSHKIFYMAITKALAERGHHVTIVSSYRNSKALKNVRDIAVSTFDKEDVLSTVFAKEGADDVFRRILQESPSICVEALAKKEVQDLKKEQFDVILISVFFNYCQLTLVEHFKVPFIYVSPSEVTSPITTLIGQIDFPSIVPHKLLEISFPATFVQRMQTTLLNILASLVFLLYLHPKMVWLCKERGLYYKDTQSLAEINKNMSMAIINSVRTLEFPPRPMMPNIVYAGGAHISPAKKLPQDLEDWITGSGDEGFIYFSLGSALKPSLMPERYRKILARAFGSLGQRVLWKWDRSFMEDLPGNVRLQKWLPQQDVLAHAKLKLFISHGGMLSTQESTFHGVPLIGMPVFADQFSNVRAAEREGWAAVVHWEDLEEEAFVKVINDTLRNKRLKEVCARRSALMKDTLVAPDQEAAFWVEYVIRHKGAPHLTSPIWAMKWYEIFNLDVWAFIVSVISGAILLLYFLLKFIVQTQLGVSGSYNFKSKDQ